MNEIKVDHIGFEPLQAAFAARPDEFRPPIRGRRANWRTQIAEFAGDYVLVTIALDCVSDQFLVAAPDRKRPSCQENLRRSHVRGARSRSPHLCRAHRRTASSSHSQDRPRKPQVRRVTAAACFCLRKPSVPHREQRRFGDAPHKFPAVRPSGERYQSRSGTISSNPVRSSSESFSAGRLCGSRRIGPILPRCVRELRREKATRRHDPALLDPFFSVGH